MDWSQFSNLPQGGLLSSQAFAPLAMYRAFRSGMPFNMPRPSPIPQYLPPPLPNWHYAPPTPAGGRALSINDLLRGIPPPTPAPAGGRAPSINDLLRGISQPTPTGGGLLDAPSTSGDFSAASNG